MVQKFTSYRDSEQNNILHKLFINELIDTKYFSILELLISFNSRLLYQKNINSKLPIDIILQKNLISLDLIKFLIEKRTPIKKETIRLSIPNNEIFCLLKIYSESYSNLYRFIRGMYTDYQLSKIILLHSL